MAESQATAPAKVAQPEPDYSKMKFRFLEQPKQRGKLSRLLRRHQYLWTLIGTTIILLTYVVRDGLLENYKGFSSALGSAQETYTMHTRFSHLEKHLSHLGKKLNALERKDSNNLYGDYLRQSYEMDAELLDIYPLELKNCADLIDALPDEMQRDARVRISALQQSFEKSKAAYPTDDISAEEKLEKRDEVMFKFGDQERSLAVLFEDVTRDVKNAKATSEEKYRTFKSLSYFLYGFGSILGLVGRLVGVGGVGDE
jgi:hypothetical protein